MAYGYSQTMAHQIKEKHKANPSDPLLELLDICVANDIAPSLIAMALHVSKQTVYDWIANKYSPRLYTQGDIKALLKIYRKEYKKKG